MRVRPTPPDPKVLAWLDECQELHLHPEERVSVHQCRWCLHDWHGGLCEPEWRRDGCRCESSRTSRDDSWRPWNFGGFALRFHAYMDMTGLDGWAARAVVSR